LAGRPRPARISGREPGANPGHIMSDESEQAAEGRPTPEPETSSESGASAIERQVREALHQIVDPELGLDVVRLGLIREISLESDPAEIRMILTTPFCPYAGVMVQQVKSAAEAAVGRSVVVTLLDETWSPELMEGGDLSSWGLV
jgi:metal-sulfur cluster biosynthetic enzyme